MNSKHFLLATLLLPQLTSLSLATEVTLRVVDQFNVDIPGSTVQVVDVSSTRYPTGTRVSLTDGEHVFNVIPSAGGSLQRQESSVVSSTSTEIAFAWITSTVRIRVVDQYGTDIPGSMARFRTNQDVVPSEGQITLPITDESIYPSMAGAERTGYQFFVGTLAALNFQGGLGRVESGVEVTSSTSEITFQWITAPVLVRVVDQHGVEIPGSIARFRTNQDVIPTGTVFNLPITDESIYPTMVSAERDGYRFLVAPSVGISSSGPSGIARVDNDVEILESTSELDFEWITSDVRINVVDQSGAQIPGSITRLRTNQDVIPTGTIFTLPITDETVYPTMVAAERNGYQFLIAPGLDGVALGRLSRISESTEVGAATSVISFEWDQIVCPLFVVDSNGVPVAGSTITFPNGFEPRVLHNGDTVVLPVTENGVYSTLFGDYANGYPLNIAPGNLSGINDTFDFEMLTSSAFVPSSFVIGGNTYSLVCLANRAPTADAGQNLGIASFQQSQTTISGSASDPEGDSLTYRWLEGESVLLGSTAVPPSGDADLALADVAPLSIGVHVLTLEVDDGSLLASSQMRLTVGNSAPTAACSGAGTYQLGVDQILLTASVADFDGDALAWQWAEGLQVVASGNVAASAGGATVELPNVTIATGYSAPGEFGIGTHALTLSVSDGLHPPVNCNANVVVIDTLAPTLAPIVTPAILWPPNHKMIPVAVVTHAVDLSGGLVLLAATVSSSEDATKDGSGHTIPDFTVPVIDQVHGTISLQLRAERAGNGPGRTYTITISAVDVSGNQSTAVVSVIAPHDRG